jgi:ribonuclease P protein component
VVLPGTGGTSRIGLSSGRKVGEAVTRNRVKRRMREILRVHRPFLTRSVDLVLVASPKAALLTFPEMEQEVASLLRKAGLLAAERGTA